MVGAKGFEPSTSWSRNRVAKILKALSGVAYVNDRASFSLLRQAVPITDGLAQRLKYLAAKGRERAHVSLRERSQLGVWDRQAQHGACVSGSPRS